MLLMNDMDLPVNAIRGYIESAIDIIIQIDRMGDGRRRITSISEVIGMNENKIETKQIFSFKQIGIANDNSVIGEFVYHKYIPIVYEKIKRKGITSVDDIFKKKK